MSESAKTLTLSASAYTMRELPVYNVFAAVGILLNTPVSACWSNRENRPTKPSIGVRDLRLPPFAHTLFHATSTAPKKPEPRVAPRIIAKTVR